MQTPRATKYMEAWHKVEYGWMVYMAVYGEFVWVLCG